MIKAGSHLTFGGTIGTQFVRNDPFGHEAPAFYQLEQNRLPDMAALRVLFSPPTEALPQVEVRLADLSSYDQLVGNAASAEEVAA